MRSVACGFVLSVTMVVVAPSPVGAQAAPGWILWEKSMISKPGAGAPESVTWEPLDGYESIAECRRSAQEPLKAAVAHMKSGAGKVIAVRPDGRSAVFAATNAGAQQTIDIRYLCFPGAFDPRPPALPASAAKP
jgi:hypothetical protein